MFTCYAMSSLVLDKGTPCQKNQPTKRDRITTEIFYGRRYDEEDLSNLPDWELRFPAMSGYVTECFDADSEL